MRVRPLSPLAHPDFNDVVVHFTGRTGDEQVANNRLLGIIESGQVLASQPYGTDLGAACFTESTAPGVAWLIAQRHFAPFGVAFTKQFLFANGGGPAIVVRGDEWHHVATLPPALRARAVRLWPGAVPDAGEHLPNHLATRSEWLIEREWRIPADVGFPALTFTTEQIAFLVVPEPTWIERSVRILTKARKTEAAHRLANSRWVAISADGQIAGNNGVRIRS